MENPHPSQRVADGTLAPTGQALAASSSRPLLRDESFWGLTATQFLGAFNDNVFKQALLLLFVAVPTTDAPDGPTTDLQWLGTLLFSLPFILFSGYAGYLSDRNSKRTVIVLSKVAEIVVMAAGLVLFIILARSQMSLAMAGWFSLVLFLMGTQSAFFGPGKYGVLPELFRERDLPTANGIILMTTFMAIILGSALAGLLLTAFPSQFWVVGVACVFIAAIGTLTSMLLRRLPAVEPGMRFRCSALAISTDMRKLLLADRPLLLAVLVSSIFWMAAAIVQMAVNALGKLQLGQSEFRTSLMVSTVSVGIAIGSLIAGATSRGKFNTRVLKTGVYGMTACLVLLALPGPQNRHLLGYEGSIVVLTLLGGFTGMFAVPLQVFMQMRPPQHLKGRMIATMNLCNWIGITLSAGLYFAADYVFGIIGQPKSSHFAFTAVLMGLVAVLYRPQSETLSNSSSGAHQEGVEPESRQREERA